VTGIGRDDVAALAGRLCETQEQALALARETAQRSLSAFLFFYYH
jgi:hypothetical protein